MADERLDGPYSWAAFQHRRKVELKASDTICVAVALPTAGVGRRIQRKPYYDANVIHRLKSKFS
jgi:hypothetical protein